MDIIAGGTVLALKKILAPLKARIAALEAKPHVTFCGVWNEGTTYAPSDATTHHGGLWIGRAETVGEPSKDLVAWQLAVKARSL
jgi:hypothetical protein